MTRWMVTSALALVLFWAIGVSLRVALGAEAGHSGGAVYRESGGNVLTADSGGTIGIESGGTLNAKPGSTTTIAGALTLPSGTANTTATLAASATGQDIYTTADDFTLTLPPPVAGAVVTVHVGNITGSTGFALAVTSPAKLRGNGFTAAAGKGAILAHATARDGDFLKVTSDGTDYWVAGVSGTWTRAP